MRYSRRTLLGSAVCAVSIAALPARPRRGLRAQPNSGVTIERVRGSVSVIGGAGGNAVLFDAGDASALVDTGAAETEESVHALVGEATGNNPPTLVFNTHWHDSHTGGNDRYGAGGARIVAHENTRLWMSTEYYVDWQDRTYQPRADIALPNDTFFSSAVQPIVVEHGNEIIEYAHLREAHTDGDIYVRFIEHNVIAAGGVCTAGRYPVPDYATGGWIGGMIDATQRLIELSDAQTLIVPGHGPVRSREHLQQQHRMLVEVRERMEALMREGRSADEMHAAGVTDEFDAYWGDNSERFVANVYGGLWWVGRLTNSL